MSGRRDRAPRDRDSNRRRKSPQQQGRRREGGVMEAIGAKAQPGSGSNHARPGDGIDDEALYELKTTDTQSFRITLKVWEDLCTKAVMQGRRPVLLLDIAGTKLRVERG